MNDLAFMYSFRCAIREPVAQKTGLGMQPRRLGELYFSWAICFSEKSPRRQKISTKFEPLFVKIIAIF
jgi:hypothetical protein